MAGTSISGPHPTIANLKVDLIDENGNIILGHISAAPTDTTASTYQTGAILIVTGAANKSNAIYQNTGTLAAPVWSQQGSGAASVTQKGYYSVALQGSSAVTNVFGATTPFGFTITGFYVSANDTVASNISLQGTGGSLAIIAKGTTQYALTGSTLNNAAIPAGGTLSVVSSASGVVMAFINFQTP